MKLEITELIVSWEHFRRPEQLYELYAAIGSATLQMNQMQPDKAHMVFVKVPSELP